MPSVGQTLLDVLHVGAVGADEHDQQGLLAAEIVAADGLAGDNVGEREVGAVVPSSSMVDSVSAISFPPISLSESNEVRS